MLITGLTSGSIFKQTSVYVELDKSQTNKYQVIELIQDYPALEVNPKTGIYSIGKGISV
jgi:hypothetical protein